MLRQAEKPERSAHAYAVPLANALQLADLAIFSCLSQTVLTCPRSRAKRRTRPREVSDTVCARRSFGAARANMQRLHKRRRRRCLWPVSLLAPAINNAPSTCRSGTANCAVACRYDVKYGAMGVLRLGYRAGCVFALGSYNDALTSSPADLYTCPRSRESTLVCATDARSDAVCATDSRWDGYYRSNPVRRRAWK